MPGQDGRGIVPRFEDGSEVPTWRLLQHLIPSFLGGGRGIAERASVPGALPWRMHDPNRTPFGPEHNVTGGLPAPNVPGFFPADIDDYQRVGPLPGAVPIHPAAHPGSAVGDGRNPHQIEANERMAEIQKAFILLMLLNGRRGSIA